VVADFAIVVSGLLLFTADLETFLCARVFDQDEPVTLLLVNGAVLTSAERRASRGAGGAWACCVTAIASLALVSSPLQESR
jgi:hypothetical protein